MATNGTAAAVAGVRPSRRTFLFGAGVIAATPIIDACTFTKAKPKPVPLVQLYGRPGSFGLLGGRKRLLGGQSFGTVPIPGWGFGPGQAAYMSAVTSEGTVIMATTPYTDNQMQPTANTMELVCLIPGTKSFGRILVPSTTGRTSLAATGSSYGGGDIGDVQVVGKGANERVLFVSAVPYHGWNVSTEGLLPSFGALRPGPRGRLSVDLTRQRTANQLAAGSTGMKMPLMGNTYGQTVSNSRGMCEMALLPASGDVVVTQYFGPSMSNQQGGLLVLDAYGRIKASWQYPAATYRGGPVKCLVREVETDPSSHLGDERFIIVCDTFDANDNPVPFPLQEFTYDARSATIRPVSGAVQAAADGSRNETAKYGTDGTLYVARTRPDGLTADRVAVYRKHRLGHVAPATAGWATQSWNQIAAPDQFVSGTENTGLVRSLALDPVSGAIVVTGLSGQLLALRGAVGSVKVTASVDLGLNQLVDRNQHNIGVRKGAVDATRRALWLPVPQLEMNQPYPAGSYPNLDQWLYRVDLAQLIGH